MVSNPENLFNFTDIILETYDNYFLNLSFLNGYNFELCRNYIKVYQFNSDINEITDDHRPKDQVDEEYRKKIVGM